MPLINFQTDLTNLPWGRDKRDNGDSNQPYVTKDIPTGLESDDLPVRSGPDFIIRGGLKSVSNALDDVSRLAQMFIDTKNPSAGLGFIAKQNILSRTSVKTPASYGLGYAGGGFNTYFFEPSVDGLAVVGGGNINQGVYTPVSTLAAALGTGLGVHPNLFGIDPFSPISGVVQGSLFGGDLGINTYEAATKKLNETADGNRLVIFNGRAKEVSTDPDVNIYSYQGGPGAVLGIGKTNIRFADQRTGAANSEGMGIIAGTYQVGKPAQTYADKIPDLTVGDFSSTGASYATNKYYQLYADQTNSDGLFGGTGDAIFVGPNGFTQRFNNNPNQIISGSLTPDFDILYANNSRTFTQKQLISQDNVIEGESAGLYPTDFRKQLYTSSLGNEQPPTDDLSNPTQGGSQRSTVLSISPSYRDKNKDERLNMGKPGREGGELRDGFLGTKNVWNYGLPANELQALDKITAMPMYDGVGPDVNQPINDLVKFRIAAINNDKSDGEAVYMHFRAFIDSFADNYTSNWNSVNYVGRGDTLYNYGGFTRAINLSFTVAAQSKAELIPMYKKLNYLASTLAPDYTSAGFMRGNLVRLTVGGYLYEQPGFITSLTYDIQGDTPWEIAINEEGGSDGSVKELPHVIRVSGLAFTPIHTFLPEKPNNANNPNSKFIALSNGVNNNYNDEYLTYQPSQGSGGDNNNQT